MKCVFRSALLLGLFVFMLRAEAEPQISKVTLAVLPSGTATTLVIDGVDLAPNARLILPVPIAAQTIKDGANAKQLQVELKLADNVPPGIYLLRVGSDKGISAPVPVEVDDLPAQPFGPQVARLPSIVYGTLSGSAVLQTGFVGKKGQRLVVELEARRLGSAIDPIVKLYDAKRLQIAWAPGNIVMGGDARIVTTLPADGPYTIELHDIQFKAGTPNRFRLRIGDLQYAELPFPLAGQRGTKAAFGLIGSVPEKTRIEVDLAKAPGGSFLLLPRLPGISGLSPRILVSDLPEVLEAEQPAGKLQEVSAPLAINGRLGRPKEEDRYRLRVEPGMKLRFDVQAERLGSGLDGVLVLRNEAGAQLLRSDDQPGTLDPGMEFTVPAGVKAVIAAISDLQGRGGPTFVYRLTVLAADQPDFGLALFEDRVHVPRAGAAVIRVRATRTGYAGPIKLTVPGLPPGVAVTGDEIPAGATDTLLTLTAPDAAQLGQAVLRITGASMEPSLERLALPAETALTRVLPWLRGEIGVAVIEPGPITIAWETPAAKLPIGANIGASVKLTRAPELKGNIRLALLTSQVVPKAKDGKDDVNRAVRLEGIPVLTPDKLTAELKILVPADLPPLPYDCTLRAELLAADGKTVQATAVTPARRLPAGK